jgi:hypothetical protein
MKLLFLMEISTVALPNAKTISEYAKKNMRTIETYIVWLELALFHIHNKKLSLVCERILLFRYKRTIH